jgi:hypothetical protein
MSAIRERLTYANVMSTLAVFLLLGGAAFAATKLKKNSVKSKQIAAGAVKSSELANGAVTAGKLAPGLSTQGPQGPAGADGSSVFDSSIPSGKTLTGIWVAAEGAAAANERARAVVSFVVPAPVPLTDATTGVGTGSAGGTSPTTAQIQGATNNAEEDPACAGTALAPTAPAGRLCFYIGGGPTGLVNVDANSLAVFHGTGGADASTAFEERSGGVVRVQAAAAGEVAARGVWAYTAP